MTGVIYAVGVGPGDPDLLTLKTVKTIDRCPCIAVPHADKEKSVAYKIASQVCDLAGKEILEFAMPMSKDPLVLEQAHAHGADVIAAALDAGKDVAFLTLGDPSIYATTSYITQRLEQKGYPVVMVSGVPSFAAVAARLGISLGLGDEEIHILPGSSSVADALALPGTRVVMKIGSKLESWKAALSDYAGDLYIVENCGMPNEQVHRSIAELDHKLSYFTILILKGIIDYTKQKIEAGRAFTHWSEEEYESDQMLKRPQPPLVKAAVSDIRISLPRNFGDLAMENDLAKLMYMRRSHRVYTEGEIDLLTLSFLLWAQQGIKSIRGNNYATLRTVPSGGARHPFEVYMVIQHVTGVEPGLYHYLPMEHEMEQLSKVDPQDAGFRKAVNDSLCGQIWALKASVIFYYSMIPYRGEWRYSIDAHRPMLLDAGHVSQNLYLACTALGIGTCAIAACDTPLASELFGLDGVEEYAFYSCPVGTVDVKNEEEEQAFYAFLKEE